MYRSLPWGTCNENTELGKIARQEDRQTHVQRTPFGKSGRRVSVFVFQLNRIEAVLAAMKRRPSIGSVYMYGNRFAFNV